MKYPLNALMVQGTTSDAGKSVLVAGLCRILANQKIKVAPFKPQNMALNSAVTPDGKEIGRAQYMQAMAARAPANVLMNPVLLKPNSDIGSQVIINGEALANMDAVSYHAYKPKLIEPVCSAFRELQQSYNTVIVEGAGSPAEINLREHDIANMGFAQAVDIEVIIVADIDKGGVFAHLYGTYALLSESEQRRVRGFVINKFRGDRALLESGNRWLTAKTGKPVLGVIPYIHDLILEAEDSVNFSQPKVAANSFKVVVPVVSRISNHTDFDPLRVHPNIDLQFIKQGCALPACDLIILPGTKSVRADLDLIKKNGWHQDIYRHLRFGGKVMGICGGYQMLGTSICDPDAIEGPAGTSCGLNLLDIETRLHAKKCLQQASGKLILPDQNPVHVTGYEIHAGISTNYTKSAPLELKSKNNFFKDGALDSNNQVFGTYLHGIFEQSGALNAILSWAGAPKLQELDFKALQEQNFEHLAKVLTENLDLDAIFAKKAHH